MKPPLYSSEEISVDLEQLSFDRFLFTVVEYEESCINIYLYREELTELLRKMALVLNRSFVISEKT